MSVTVIKSPCQCGLLDLELAHASIFIGGGISNCPLWQDEFIKEFTLAKENDDRSYILVNPRREGDLARVGSEADKQIRWERLHLQACSHAVFWFPKESLCPITLFELGHYATKERLTTGRTIVGSETGYQREFDVRTQLSLIAGVPLNIHKSVIQLARAAAFNTINWK